MCDNGITRLSYFLEKFLLQHENEAMIFMTRSKINDAKRCHAND